MITVHGLGNACFFHSSVLHRFSTLALEFSLVNGSTTVPGPKLIYGNNCEKLGLGVRNLATNLEIESFRTIRR